MFYNLMAVILRHCVTVLNFTLVPVKGRLHGITFGMNDCLKGGLPFENEIRNAYWWALRIEKPSRFGVLRTNGNDETFQYEIEKLS